MTSATDTIQQNANYTAQAQASATKQTGATQKLGSSDFLNLMMKQLQYQDPMEPVSNTEFISQQAQFSQLDATNSMKDNIAANNGIMQTLSMVGKEITLVNPDDPKKTITGTATEAKFTSSGSTLVINGKEYPISLVTSVKNAATTTSKT